MRRAAWPSDGGAPGRAFPRLLVERRLRLAGPGARLELADVVVPVRLARQRRVDLEQLPRLHREARHDARREVRVEEPRVDGARRLGLCRQLLLDGLVHADGQDPVANFFAVVLLGEVLLRRQGVVLGDGRLCKIAVVQIVQRALFNGFGEVDVAVQQDKCEVGVLEVARQQARLAQRLVDGDDARVPDERDGRLQSNVLEVGARRQARLHVNVKVVSGHEQLLKVALVRRRAQRVALSRRLRADVVEQRAQVGDSLCVLCPLVFFDLRVLAEDRADERLVELHVRRRGRRAVRGESVDGELGGPAVV
mmetsp:Transcript_1801/g.5372  ORF Transcript_1801/g.5372 Transcript_1801/m.5372 type:complete len:308 (+) Transcript_1801:73-996(+)